MRTLYRMTKKREPKYFCHQFNHLGLNSVHFRGSILWNNLPSLIKKSQTINEFKANLKNLGSIHWTCGVCH